MTAARQPFATAGVPDASVVSETFISPDIEMDLGAPTATGPFEVKLRASCIVAEWTAKHGTLLDLAEANGIVAPSHCRAGLCGTCRTTVHSGDTESLTGAATHDATILTCCSAPLGPVELDL
ncbi:hypothetical protein DC366_04465 [Pelagivirga sediminicola]|uniref:2Fe-2S ferredoxin-type domain-containing protein n=1 Tax=Pelagivirga sediminicola TaxID=2170575 RepID=A0A2T7G9E6_9RHOB|nr:2Fe-2S iron-sulfur cluster-binding protein [Pelagivirga sediminicola]PVA11035.1 hypothetical protein DC366_04465 [Pelagivirga sediminicola]